MEPAKERGRRSHGPAHALSGTEFVEGGRPRGHRCGLHHRPAHHGPHHAPPPPHDRRAPHAVVHAWPAGRDDRRDQQSGNLRVASDMPMDCDILLFQRSAKRNRVSKEDVDAEALSNLAYAISMEVLHPGPSS